MTEQRPPTIRKVPLLPEEGRLILIRAAHVASTPEDPLARQKAIDTAIQRVKRLYPTFFKSED